MNRLKSQTVLILPYLILVAQLYLTFLWTSLRWMDFVDSEMYTPNVKRVTLLMLGGLLCGSAGWFWLPKLSKALCTILLLWTIWWLPETLWVYWDISAHPPHTKDLRKLTKAGDVAMANGDFAAAERIYSHVLQKEKTGYFRPYTWVAVFRLTTVLEKQHKWNEAEQVYLAALRDPELAKPACPLALGDARITANQNLADIYRRQERYFEAERQFKKVLKMDESVNSQNDWGEIACHEDLAKVLRASGKLEEARLEENRAQSLREARR